MANGLVMAYKRLEETTFTWPAIRDGVMTLNRARHRSERRAEHGAGAGPGPGTDQDRLPLGTGSR